MYLVRPITNCNLACFQAKEGLKNSWIGSTRLDSFQILLHKTQHSVNYVVHDKVKFACLSHLQFLCSTQGTPSTINLHVTTKTKRPAFLTQVIKSF